MRVLFYRDCRALNRIQIAKATVEGTVVSDPYTVGQFTFYLPLAHARTHTRQFWSLAAEAVV